MQREIVFIVYICFPLYLPVEWAGMQPFCHRFILLMHVMKPNNEKELFLFIAQGDEEAFRQLFHLYMPRLYPMILKVTRTENAAEDVLQETFLRVWMNRDKLPGIESPWAWILQIAYYQSFTYLRKQITHEKAVNKLSDKSGNGSLSSATEEAVAFRTMQNLIAQAINKLPSQQKKVYLLSREEGLKVPEIASRMSLSEQSVKNTLVRALKFIRRHIEQSGYIVITIIFQVIQYFGHR